MSQPDSKLANRGVYVQKPRSNVYTVLLAIALVAIIIGCIFLYLEIQQYDGDITASNDRLSVPLAERTQLAAVAPGSATRFTT